MCERGTGRREWRFDNRNSQDCNARLNLDVIAIFWKCYTPPAPKKQIAARSLSALPHCITQYTAVRVVFCQENQSMGMFCGSLGAFGFFSLVDRQSSSISELLSACRIE